MVCALLGVGSFVNYSDLWLSGNIGTCIAGMARS